ncbi:MAG: ice-binding family protein [Polyangiaceae bacterium]
MRFDEIIQRVAPAGALRVGAVAALLFASFTWGSCDAGGITTITGGTGASTSSSSSSAGASGGFGGGAGGSGGAECGTGVTLCDETCVKLTNDPAHCGGCDKPCSEGELCSASQCGQECVGGSTECSSLCVDMVNDPANCGACGTVCDAGELCSASQCGLECVGGSTECGLLCVDIQNDPAHCGACGNICDPGEVCSASQCDLECVGGSTECGLLCKDLQTDEANCGACDAPCVADEVCVAGDCGVPPTVSTVNPLDGATGVALDRTIEVTFSAPMNPLTIDETTFTVVQEVSQAPVAGVVDYDGITATFEPLAGYPPSTLLTATITTGAESTTGQALSTDYEWSFTTGTQNAQQPVVLGLASPYAILAFNTVTNVNNPGTIVTGDLGISPGSALVGFPPGIVNGVMQLGTPEAALAKGALLAAYNDAANRLGAAVLPGDLSGLTFAPGLYKNATSVQILTGNFTLDAQGDSNAVFIFQMGSTLTTSPGTQVILAGGAKATNIFWAVGTSATLGTTSKFKGTILAASAISMNTGAEIEGRLLAQGAAVALDTNVITVPAP